MSPSSPGSGSAPKKFPDFVPPTKVAYSAGGAPKLHLRSCLLVALDESGTPRENVFQSGEIRIGAMDDNDLVVRDETVSRYHCVIRQESTGYIIEDLTSTNGTFVNKVRIREAFLKSGCTVNLGQFELKFSAGEEEVEIVPSRKDRCGDLIGRHPKLREIYTIVEKIAPTSTTVVIQGETGTGKEVVAQSIHNLSNRAAGPMMIFDCGAVPANLIESELFGHEKGSFTGAIMTRQGLFEMSDGGTLFLDELGELPLDLQPKLLRALEQREVRRVGGNKSIRVDVRILAATNRDLEEEVKAGRFRQDLFYRLSVVRLKLPALRDRVEDVPLLVNHFLERPFNMGPDGQPRVTGLSQDAANILRAYSWPGNVRELVNCVERSVSFAEGNVIESRDLPDHIREASGAGRIPMAPPGDRERAAGVAEPEATALPARPAQEVFESPFKDAKEKWVATFERDYIVNLLKKNNGNISHAARESDIDRKYFRKLMKKYGIEADVGDDDDD